MTLQLMALGLSLGVFLAVMGMRDTHTERVVALIGVSIILAIMGIGK